MDRGYMSRVLRLMLLAPDIIDVILTGGSRMMRQADLLDGVARGVRVAAQIVAMERPAVRVT